MRILSLRLPDDIHEKLVKLAQDEHRSLNAQIVHLLGESLKRMDD